MKRTLNRWKVKLQRVKGGAVEMEFASFWSRDWDGIESEVGSAAAAMLGVTTGEQHVPQSVEFIDSEAETLGARA